MNEGLTFEPVPEPPEQNRLFIIIAIGLVGMLVLGLLGIGGYVIFSRSKRSSTQAQQVVQSTPVVLLATDTPTVMATDTPLPTRTSTPIRTNTPVVLMPTQTSALVVLQATTTPLSGFFGALTPETGSVGAAAATEVVVIPGITPQATQIVVIENPTATPISAPQQATTTPDTGFGLGALGLGAGLAFIVFIARRLRLS